MRLNRTRRQSVCACTRCLRDGGSAASGSWRPRSTQSASPRDQAQSVQPANGDSGSVSRSPRRELPRGASAHRGCAAFPLDLGNGSMR